MKGELEIRAAINDARCGCTNIVPLHSSSESVTKRGESGERGAREILSPFSPAQATLSDARMMDGPACVFVKRRRTAPKIEGPPPAPVVLGAGRRPRKRKKADRDSREARERNLTPDVSRALIKWPLDPIFFHRDCVSLSR